MYSALGGMLDTMLRSSLGAGGSADVPILMSGAVRPPLVFSRAQTSAFSTADAFDPDLPLVLAGALGSLMTFSRAQVDATATGEVP